MIRRTFGAAAVLAVVMCGLADAAERSPAFVAAPILETSLLGPGPRLRPADHPRPKRDAATLAEAIDDCVASGMAVLDTPGAAVAVILNGELIHQRGYGVKHRNQGGAVNADTVFRIGSATKQLTAAALMQQVEAGTVFLDDPVTRYVPELELDGLWPADTIRVRHLLTHTAAIPDIPFELDGRTDPQALSDWAASLDEVALHAPPGLFWNYSNPNFMLAGLIVERASGMSYRDYMHERVFALAGMNDTTFDPDAVMAGGNYSYGHTDVPGMHRLDAPDDYDNAVPAPAGYAFSTAGDLARWALLLMDGGGEVLSNESAAEMQRPHAPLDVVPGDAYGYGIFIEGFRDIRICQHGGNIPGWGTYLIWRPERRFAVAVLANTFQSLAGAAYCITDAVLEPGPWPPVEGPADPATWGRFEGDYTMTDQLNRPFVGQVFAAGSDHLALWLTSPMFPGWSDLYVLEPALGATFLVDLDGDGTAEWPFTFLGEGTPQRARWLRSRILVGGLRSEPRDGGVRP